MKRYYYILLILFSFSYAKAQDPHFSQFFASPLTLNPANTGNFDGALRVASNYRNQWPGFGNAYITSTVTLDGSFLQKALPVADKLSGGIVLLSDQTGNGIIKENHLLLSVAYQKSLDDKGKHSLTLAFQGGIGNYFFDVTKANFEDEISPSGFTIPSSEVLLTMDLRKMFMDIHTGILYKWNFANNGGVYLGSSIYHLGRPKLAFYSNNYNVNYRFNIHGGGFKELSELTTLHASFQYQRHFNYKEFLLGAALSNILIDRANIYSQLYVGAWIRDNGAVIPYLGLEWNNLRAGFSYDFNYSNKKSTSSLFQSCEFSLLWVLAKSVDVQGVRCPKF